MKRRTDDVRTAYGFMLREVGDAWARTKTFDVAVEPELKDLLPTTWSDLLHRAHIYPQFSLNNSNW